MGSTCCNSQSDLIEKISEHLNQSAEYWNKFSVSDEEKILTDFVQKAYCNTGLGTELMKYMLSMAKEFGFHRVDLTVRTYNEAGIKLYEKVGFERIGLSDCDRTPSLRRNNADIGIDCKSASAFLFC